MAKFRIGVFPIFFLLFFIACPLYARPISAGELKKIQSALRGKPTGEKIAFWAQNFIGLPYDPDPQGEYVTRAVIVADERVDCMYLTFRAVELALSCSPEEAIQIALNKRFHNRGILREGKVANYEDRFQYGEDMIESRKWGKEITSKLGRTVRIPGCREKEFFEILPTSEILKGRGKLKSGDLLFFMKSPEKRLAEEGVGHIGIVKVEGKGTLKRIYLIHACGRKNQGGAVKKVRLTDYLSQMPFVGVRVTRFE